MTQPQIQVDIKPLGLASAVCPAPFDQALETLVKQGYQIIQLWQNALLREQKGYSHSVSTSGNWVREGDLYIPGENTRLLRNSLCLNNPKQATQAHRDNQEYTLLTSEEIEKARTQGLEIKAQDLDKYDDLIIPTKEFGSNNYAIFLFGGQGTDTEKSKRAKTHGQWLLDSPKKLNKITIFLDNKNYVNKKCKPYANQLWLRSLGDNSVVGYSRNLSCNSGVRGVLESCEAGAKNFKSYSKEQINKTFKTLQWEGLTKQFLDTLQDINL